MIDKIRQINAALIKQYKDNQEELKKQNLIKKILEDKYCFLKMDIDTAFSLLKDLNIPDEYLKDIYLELI